MKSLEQQNVVEQEDSPDVAQVKNMIATTRQELMDEYKNTKNSWMECFVARIHNLKLSMELAENEIDPKEYRVYKGRLRALENEARELHTQYPRLPNKDEDKLPEEIKEDLLERVENLLREEYKPFQE